MQIKPEYYHISEVRRYAAVQNYYVGVAQLVDRKEYGGTCTSRAAA
ncbi:hypothetical protein HNO88_001593 [Novosphingobium chloroacetimidivorans]|uniref:Uncharacterized protein n=1 Tax=Novosphingobium chloroacetimidivorans TaxID=1428314 RepID=A0A7W7NWC2_9SPHN|nr:hypothetical protein [Novosphingobium chloroacetimidivorans]